MDLTFVTHYAVHHGYSQLFTMVLANVVLGVPYRSR